MPMQHCTSFPVCQLSENLFQEFGLQAKSAKLADFEIVCATSILLMSTRRAHSGRLTTTQASAIQNNAVQDNNNLIVPRTRTDDHVTYIAYAQKKQLGKLMIGWGTLSLAHVHREMMSFEYSLCSARY